MYLNEDRKVPKKLIQFTFLDFFRDKHSYYILYNFLGFEFQNLKSHIFTTEAESLVPQLSLFLTFNFIQYKVNESGDSEAMLPEFKS